MSVIRPAAAKSPATSVATARSVSPRGADRRSPAIDVEDGGESGRLPIEVFDGSATRPRRPLAVFQRPQRAVLRLQPTGREGLAGRARIVLAAGNDGRIQGAYDCIKAFSETDFTEDLKKFDMPTLIIHGDDDQIVPIGASAMLSSKIIQGATLKIYPGAPHGLCSTLKDQVNEDLLAFFQESKQAAV